MTSTCLLSWRRLSVATILTALLLAAALPAPVAARIGETDHDLVERFGQPVVRQPEKAMSSSAGTVVTVGERLVFTTDMWGITATITAGHCVKLTYIKPGDWTEEQFTSLLSSNASKLTWREHPSSLPKIKRDWTRDDGATAVWVQTGGFTFTAPAFEKQKTAAIEAATRKAERVPKF